MTYLLDTNAVSDLIREHEVMKQRITAASAHSQIVLNPVVVAETRFGLERLPEGARKSTLPLRVNAVLSAFESVPVDDNVARHYVRIRLFRKTSGRPMSDNDLWIAAIASALGAVLVTRDQDFQDIPGLLLENWSDPAQRESTAEPDGATSSQDHR